MLTTEVHDKFWDVVPSTPCDRNFGFLCAAIKASKAVLVLRIIGKIETEGGSSFFAAQLQTMLRNNVQLWSLTIHDNPVDLSEISKGLASWCSATSDVQKDRGLDKAPAARHLDLCACDLGDISGLAALAGALASCVNLTSLNLASNRIQSDGVIALARALGKNAATCALQRLILHSNQISDSGGQALAQLIMEDVEKGERKERQLSLTELDVAANEIGTVAVAALRRAAWKELCRTNGKAWTVSLQGNPGFLEQGSRPPEYQGGHEKLGDIHGSRRAGALPCVGNHDFGPPHLVPQTCLPNHVAGPGDSDQVGVLSWNCIVWRSAILWQLAEQLARSRPAPHLIVLVGGEGAAATAELSAMAVCPGTVSFGSDDAGWVILCTELAQAGVAVLEIEGPLPLAGGARMFSRGLANVVRGSALWELRVWQSPVEIADLEEALVGNAGKPTPNRCAIEKLELFCVAAFLYLCGFAAALLTPPASFSWASARMPRTEPLLWPMPLQHSLKPLHAHSASLVLLRMQSWTTVHLHLRARWGLCWGIKPAIPRYVNWTCGQTVLVLWALPHCAEQHSAAHVSGTHLCCAWRGIFVMRISCCMPRLRQPTANCGTAHRGWTIPDMRPWSGSRCPLLQLTSGMIGLCDFHND